MFIIKKIPTPLPYREFSLLLRDAFAERKDAGLNFACASFDQEDVKNHLSNNAVVFGAYQDNVLVGMNVLNSIRDKFGIRFGTHELLAVANNVKHQGIGSALFKELVREAKSLKLDFILSDTAEQATSSIKYHEKNGFLIYGKSHYVGRTYDSVNFILPLTFKGRLLSSWIGRKILSTFFTHK